MAPVLLSRVLLATMPVEERGKEGVSHKENRWIRREAHFHPGGPRPPGGLKYSHSDRIWASLHEHQLPTPWSPFWALLCP